MRRQLISFAVLATVLSPAPFALADADSINWHGFYAGVQGGAAAIDSRSAYDIIGNGYFVLKSAAEFDGLFGGIHGGYNFAFGDGPVFGFEADANLGDTSIDDVKKYIGELESYSARDFYDVNSFGSARLRAGWAFGNFMPFITGGVAVADYDYGFKAKESSFSAKGSDLAVGYTLGGGAEYAISKRVRLRAEYRYTDYGSAEVKLTTDTTSPAFVVTDVELKSHAVTMGVSFAF